MSKSMPAENYQVKCRIDRVRNKEPKSLGKLLVSPDPSVPPVFMSAERHGKRDRGEGGTVAPRALDATTSAPKPTAAYEPLVDDGKTRTEYLHGRQLIEGDPPICVPCRGCKETREITFEAIRDAVWEGNVIYL